MRIDGAMKIFFGAAIQGAHNREERAAVHRLIIDAIKSCGCEVISEHTTGRDYDATAQLLEKSLGTLSPNGMERTVLIRNKMIEFIEGDIDAAAVSGHGLINGVVHNLPDEVVESPRTGRTYVHGRASAHGLEALKDLD